MKKVINTVAEQLIYTACFFLTQALVSRSIPIEEFAEFSAFYSSVILLSIIHTCTVAEPILVFIKKGNTPKINSLLSAHIPAIIFIIASTFYITTNNSEKLGPEYLISLLSFLIYWTSRSIAWKSGGIIKYSIPPILQVTCILILTACGKANLSNILLTISASLLFPSLFIGRNKRPGEDLRILESLKFSSLNLTSQTLLWAMTHGLVTYYLNTERPMESAHFRILLTLILPAQYINIALSNHYLPILSKEVHSSSEAVLFLLLSTTAGATYGLVLYFAGNNLAGILFGQSFSQVDVSTYFALPIIFSTIQSTRTILKSQQKNTAILISISIGGIAFIGSHLQIEKLEINSFIGLTISALSLSLLTMKAINNHPKTI